MPGLAVDTQVELLAVSIKFFMSDQCQAWPLILRSSH